MTADTQINWLELARFAAAGQGHADLGRGVQRLATLAAAIHRHTVAGTPSTVRTEKDTQWVQGRTPQATPTPAPGNVNGNGKVGTRTEAGIGTLAPEAWLPGAEDAR